MESLTSPDRRNQVALLLVMTLGAAAGVATLYATRWGPWAGSDSVEYFEAARNLAAGEGLVLVRASGRVVPLSLRPPFYPIVLATAAVLGTDILVAARATNVVLITLLLIVLGVSIHLLVKSLLLTLSVVLATLSAPAIHRNFTGAMSEPLFLTLGVTSLLLVAWYLQMGKRSWLIASALCAGLAFLTRFAGFTFVIVGALGILLLDMHARPKKVRAAAIFISVGMAPFLVWIFGLVGSGNSPGVYSLPEASIWIATSAVRIALVEALWSWIPFAESLPNLAYDPKLDILVAITLGTVILMLITGWAKQIPLRDLYAQPATRLALLFGGFAAIYVCFVTATFILVRVPQPTLYERILFPAPYALFMALLISMWLAASALKRFRYPGVFPLALSLAFIASNLKIISTEAVALNRSGAGFTSRTWQQSETVQVLRNFEEDLPLVSNRPEAVMFFLERPAYGIPELEKEEPLPQFTAFGQDSTSAADRAFREQGAALVLFNGAIWQFDSIYHSSAEERMATLIEGLYLYSSLADGTIFFFEQNDSP
jgi:4-amino-4-deoxy-L-arabinose transferase-like glycosyltransferase